MPKRIECNDYFFSEINSQEKAYILGFLAADGNISSKSNRISIILQEDDIEILEFIQKEICPNSIIYSRNNQKIKRKPQKNLRFSSLQIKKDLIIYGIVPCKSKFEFTLDLIPNIYRKDYIRGYFDGDGCFYIGKWRKGIRVCVSFTNSTKSILESIKNELENNNIKFTLEEKISKIGNKYYVLATYNRKSLIDFGNYIYENSSFFLNRKFDKFRQVNTEVN